ncbi:MAG: hypothetical protein DIU79_06640 [Actinobacteria bacterium]|nr:MAG: hypothetical protein DIU79_06640 [Actinomycetota bacterium]
MTFRPEFLRAFSTDLKRRATLAASGLAVIGGIVLAPATPAYSPESPATSVAKQIVAQVEPQAKAPSLEQLMPNGVPANQSTYEITPERMANAKAIIEAGKEMNMPPRAWVIAIATALQESKLENLGHLGERNDHDSLGLFQQRPSTGWGTPEQIMDPNYSAKAFYQALKEVEGYERMPLTVAAQTVQVSAFPNHYAQWEKLAAELVQGVHGEGPYAELAARV